ncbi:MAG: hypothetical protein ABSD73_04670 [Candidatus Bathyarchaeia archaeon]|jgi:mRNA degradation ribonuclease J1/J2
MVKRETTLAFYGGVNEIGGNKILIKDGDTRIFFDFGMPLQLKSILKEVDAAKVFPIHTENAELFEVHARP